MFLPISTMPAQRALASAGPAATGLLLFLIASAIAIRLPILLNADASFTSDEAANALQLLHLLDGRTSGATGWDAPYYGILEGLLSIPLLWVFGPSAAAFKMGALLGHVGLMVLVFAVGARLFGAAAGLLGTALLVLLSPELVRWSTSAASGYCLIVAWGLLSVLLLMAAARDLSPRTGLFLGLGLGSGLYIYELFLPVAIVCALAMTAECIGRPLPSPRLRWLTLASFVGGVAAGLSPKLLSAGQGKSALYELASPEVAWRNVRLLIEDCLPALLGGNLDRLGVAGAGAAWMLIAGFVASWGWGLVQWRRSPRSDRARRLALAVLVALPPLVIALFVLSPNPQNVLSNRYLLPTLAAVPLAGGALAALLETNRRAAGIALGLALVLPGSSTLLWLVDQRVLDPDLGLARRREPLILLARELSSRGVEGGYARYWDAYRATFFAGERVVVAPYMQWDRFAPYRLRLAAARRVVWFFPGEQIELPAGGRADAAAVEALFLNQVQSSGRELEREWIGGYRVYGGRDEQRLLAPPSGALPRPLARASARFELQAPPSAVAGQTLRLRVRVTNTSDGPWTAAGSPLQAGALRVALACRWLSDDGTPTIPEGERSLLPRDVATNESVDMVVRAAAPATPGRAVLRVTAVQEGVAWFDTATGSFSDQRIDIVPAPAVDDPPARGQSS